MTIELIIALAGFALASSITPGPNNLMLMTSGVNFGLIRTLPHMFGVSIGFAFMVAMVGVGLVQLFDAWPASYTVLKIVSVAYLLYLAWKIATTRKMDESNAASGRPMTFLQAAAFQWVNPKAWSMALTAVTVYAPQNADTLTIGLVAVIFSLVNLPSVLTWVMIGREMSRFLATPVRIKAFNISAALLLVASLLPILAPATS